VLEAFERRGLWWLPDMPDHTVAGVLSFSQDDIALDLIGMLPREEPLDLNPRSRDRILLS
jgi:hypothetical protein